MRLGNLLTIFDFMGLLFFSFISFSPFALMGSKFHSKKYFKGIFPGRNFF